MTLSETLTSLLKLMSGSPDISILVVGFPQELVAKRLRISDDLANDFRRIARRPVIELGDEDLQAIPYDPGRKLESYEVAYLNLQDHPELSTVLSLISTPTETELFDEDDEFIESLRFYCIAVLGGTKGNAFFLREYTRNKELTRKPGIAAMLGQGVYDRLHEKIFLFDSKVDCIAHGDYLFIRNTSAFERIFNYIAEVYARADETLNAILAKVPIVNGQAFRDNCKGQPQMLSKLFQVARRPYFPSVSMADIERTIGQFKLEIEIRDIAGNRQLVFDPHPKRRWLILKLLDDNYLGSIMTNLQYEVNSKNTLPSV